MGAILSGGNNNLPSQLEVCCRRRNEGFKFHLGDEIHIRQILRFTPASHTTVEILVLWDCRKNFLKNDLFLLSHYLCMLWYGGRRDVENDPCHVFVYIRTFKKLDFSQFWVWKKTVHFLPRKVISFCWRKKNSSAQIPKFHKGQRQGQGQTPLQRRKVVSKSKISLRVLGIQISWIPLSMVNQSQTVHIEKITKTVIHSAL